MPINAISYIAKNCNVLPPFNWQLFNTYNIVAAEYMEGHSLPKDMSENFREHKYLWNYRNYNVVSEKYLKEVEDAKKKGSGYWDELLEVKEDEEEKILRKEENERWLKEKETSTEKYERRGSRREEDRKRNKEGNDNYEERKRKEKAEKERDSKEREKKERRIRKEEEDKERRKDEEEKERK